MVRIINKGSPLRYSVLWLASLLSYAVSHVALAATDQHYAYSTKRVYTPQQASSEYQQPPAGYHLVFTEMVARHGSRALSSPKYDDISLQLWRRAKAMDALTDKGLALGKEIVRMMRTNEKLGYGNLSQRGHKEHFHIGERLIKRDHALFSNAVKQHRPIVVEYSGRQRALDSGRAFISGMEHIMPALASTIKGPTVNKTEIYFHKQPINHAYQQYKEHDPQLRAIIDEIFYSPRSHQVAQQVLRTLFKSDFVNALAAGEFKFKRRGKAKAKIYNDVDAVIQLFNLYLIAPGMSAEAGQQPWTFSTYFTPEQTQWLAYIKDAEDFYEKGPGLNNTDITYKMAKVLEQDFFASIRKVQKDPQYMAAKLRFGHAETIIPFAAQMALPGSDQAMPPEQRYTWDNNPWRGSNVAPLSANIQWDIYRNNENQLLVRMLYNEKQTHFKASCQPLTANSYYYRFSELTRCYHQ